jgi:YHS domain-containing protein/uncharacterized membrane protein YraQ (UPF0718 family)
MNRDPICGAKVDRHTALNVVLGGKTHFFCGQPCLEKFAHAKGLALTGRRLMRRPDTRWERVRGDRFFQACCLTALMLASSLCFEAMARWRALFISCASAMWPWALSGLLLGGLARRFVPAEYMRALFTSKGRRTISRDIRRRWRRYKFSWPLLGSDTRGVLTEAYDLTRAVMWLLLLGLLAASLVGTFSY